MKLKTEWLPHLNAFREREIGLIFDGVPDSTFASGLELGCGGGFQSGLLTRYVDKLISSDFALDKLEGPTNGAVEFRVCDAENVDQTFERGQFDLVFSSNLLEHLPDPSRALRGCHHVLADDGIAIHVMPSQFWKACQLAFYIPDLLATGIEQFTELGPRQLIERARHEEPGSINNPKTVRARRSLLQRALSPEPHGVSAGHWQELKAFSKARWCQLIAAAGFELLAVRPGPVASGYGFGFDVGRDLFERSGFTAEHIYIAAKAGQGGRYRQLFS